jgi:hypothetical protein
LAAPCALGRAAPPDLQLPAAGAREREEEKKHLDGAAGEEKKRGARIRESREEGEMEFPKDLCANSKNCRDLSIKHNFSLN